MTKAGKFYPHSTSRGRILASLRRIEAQRQNINSAVVEYQILHLISIEKNGLPDCYGSFEDFLYDFWPNFTWSAQTAAEEAVKVFEDPRIKAIISSLNETWGIDLEEILTKTPTEEV